MSDKTKKLAVLIVSAIVSAIISVTAIVLEIPEEELLPSNIASTAICTFES